MLLQTTAIAAVAGVAVGHDGDVAQLTGHTVDAMDDAAVIDDAAADAGAESE